MSDFKQFKFKDYAFDKSNGKLELFYGYDDALDFRETYSFDFDFADYDEAALDRALQLLFFMAGVSYYKMYLAPEIVIAKGQVDERLAALLSKTYQRGLGEFFYLNHLDPNTAVTFPVNGPALQPLSFNLGDGQLIGLGGGKDSLLSVEVLRQQPRAATWSLNHRSQLEPLVDEVGMKHLWVGREWDEQIKSLNRQGALNGHVPISAIFACVGNVVAILSGFRDAVVSNESSASDPTLNYQGTDINHQYSKSLEFERDFQACLANLFGGGVRYYSLLRPYSELRIAELFSKIGFAKYQTVFSSCNRAFTHDQHHMFWCGECPKCAFVFLILTPFVDRPELEKLWEGRNLLLDPSRETIYRQLLGIEGDKPLDCVGEIKESRSAMRLAQAIYPELSKYVFDIPEGYDWRALSPHLVPSEIHEILVSKLDV
jgi:hypothetical protein